MMLDIIGNFDKQKILVIGDLMLDEFIWGVVERISPEAPVPIVDVKSCTHVLGGAANVINNIHALGGEVYPIGVVGEDSEGHLLIEDLKRKNICIEGIVSDKTRITTVKTRIIAHSQQMIRVDREKRDYIDKFITTQLLTKIKEFILYSDCVIISDYAKGVINPVLLEELFSLKVKHDKFLIVDPKLRNFKLYKGINLITPNHHEAARVCGIEIQSEEDVIKAGLQIKEMLSAESVLITRGEEGMSLFEKDGTIIHIPTEARQIYDVTGAGDTVVAILGLCKAQGVDNETSARLANIAAGIAVEKIGTSVVTKQELISKINKTYGEKGKSRSNNRER